MGKKQHKNIYKFWQNDDMLTPHGLHIREFEATDPHSCLHQGIPTYLPGITISTK